MSYPTEPLREHPSTYYVQDLSNQDEITRLEIQDKMLTTGMGGVLPELDHPELLQRVLDVGCGTGGWLIETARTYPAIEKLVGADISGKMMTYARGQVEAKSLAERVEFRTMDALRILDFPHENFDLVNQRIGVGWLRTWEWPKILLEYQRVTRSGGIIRITEPNMVESNSPALTKLCDIALEANYRSGRFFAARGDGATCELVRLMTQYGIQDVRTRIHTLIYQAGTEAGQSFFEDMLRTFRVMLPFLQKWVSVPCDYEEIYQQALNEMQQPNFVATWTWLTAWGSKSHDEELMYLWRVR